MKTRELLTADEKIVSAALKGMKIKTLEAHAQKILQLLGQDDYDAVMLALIKRIPILKADEDRFAAVKSTIAMHLPEAIEANNSATENREQSLQRLSVLMTLLVAKKFAKVHKSS